MSKPQDPTVRTFEDHEIITPPNSLAKAMVETPAGDQDPIARAEAALADLSTQFSGWMQDECTRLDAARRQALLRGCNKVTLADVFRAAHDIKGEAATLGFPHVEAIADCLCRLIDHARDKSRVPLALIDRHIDAVHAIKRCTTRLEAAQAAEPLARELNQAVANYLMHEDIEALAGLDVLSPPLAP